ncbi:sulfate adenylyltransferase subunit 1 [Sphingomonas sp.]|uniref:sulfate adenylyltransferase subunit 1 n=1 Tax=Sphingomonas sp. TaxID=28214 RepID=UPI003B00E184
MATLLAPALVAATSRPMLRVLACGSVDDGKSTLLGRLIHDAAGLYADQRPVDDDFAGLFDGLEAEREQGITIDVAYRYFATPARKFIVVDTPGHEQYTRNMVTGASNADLAIILIDATQGITRQTRRHSRVVRLLGLTHVVLAVNKLDLVGFSADRFAAIVADYRAFAATIGIEQFEAIPLAAKHGDNVVERSARTGWYAGPTLLDVLEEADVRRDGDDGFVMPVQSVLRVGQRGRWLQGTVASGTARAGDAVRVLPGGQRAHLASFLAGDSAGSGQAVSVRLAEEVDCARGDVLVAEGSAIVAADKVTADLVWFGEQALVPGARYLLKLGHRTVGARVASVRDVFEPETGAHGPARVIAANDIATVTVGFDAALAVAPFDRNTALGGFILIDPATQATVAAGLVRATGGADPAVATAYRVEADTEARAPTARALMEELDAAGRRPALIDDVTLADLKLPRGDEAALGALVRLLERAGATPVLAIGAPTAIGTPFRPDDTLTAPQDWVI